MGAKEVAAGAAWLDKVKPGWERGMDLGVLDLNDCYNCVLGQSLREVAAEKGYESGYHYGLDGLSGATFAARWAGDHGFLYESDEPTWRDLIKERFSTGNLSDN
jgi:hypothetical protein